MQRPEIEPRIKRGVAVAAACVVSMALVPLVAGSASANPATSGSTTLISPTSSQGVSVVADGQNATVSLVVSAPASATSVQFSYTPSGGAKTPIAATGRDANGLFSTEWTPPVGVLNTTVTITATADQGGTATAAVKVATNVDSVELSPPSGPVGFYAASNGAATGTAIVSGTTSSDANGPTPTVKAVVNGPGTTGSVQLATPAAGATTRSFVATVPVTVSALSSAAPTLNQFAVQANVTTSGLGSSGDGQGYVAYRQRISKIAAAASPPTVPTSGTTSVVVTVTDQQGAPAAGVRVRTSTSSTGGTTANGLTNASGQVTFTGVKAGTSSYYADDNANGSYDSATEFATTVSVTTVNQTATSLVATSADGSAFDTQEYAFGDLSARLLDQTGAGINGQPVSYRYTFLPFPTAANPNPAAATSTIAQATTATVNNVAGVARLSFPPSFPSPAPASLDGTYSLTTYVERDGTPGPSGGDLTAPSVGFKRGDATLAFSPQADSSVGSTATYTATLRLVDGTPLTGRTVALAYSAASGGNSVVATTQPSGTTRTSDTAATAVTDSSGTVRVSISDPASPTTSEQGGTLTATTTTTPNIGNAQESGTTTVSFSSSTVPGGATISFNQVSETSQPGVPTAIRTLTLKPPSGQPASTVAGVAVTLTTTNGFFTPVSDTYDPAAVTGANYGNFASLGQTTTVTTNGAGQAQFRTVIKRDLGFDDDGLVTSTITASVTGATPATASDTFSTLGTPLNPGHVDLAFSTPSVQTTSNLPKAQTADKVLIDVIARDQFGNKVGGAPVSISSTGGVLTQPGGAPLTSSTVPSDFDSTGELQLASSTSAAITVTGVWTASTTVFTSAVPGSPAAHGAGQPRTLTDPITVDFYAIDYAHSHTSLSHAGRSVRAVGATVVETFRAKDQYGQPISSIFVQFFRSGPDHNQTGESVQASGFLGPDGSLTYVFQGTVRGKARITAVPRDAGPTGNVIGGGTRVDKITFGGKRHTAPLSVTAHNSSNHRRDVISVSFGASVAPTARVALFVASGGRRHLVAVKTVGRDHRVTFGVRDHNQGKPTKYVVVIRGAQRTVVQD